MVYETFLEHIRQSLQKHLGSGCSITIHQIPKNNGKVMDGLSILMPGAQLAPTLYLNSYYEQFCNGMSLEDITADILELFYSNPAPTCLSARQMTRFDLLEEKIMFKLIHGASNQELLKDIPYIPYLDLAIVFYLFLERNASGQMTAQIHNEHMKLWNVKEKDLLALALENTPKVFPPDIKSMAEVIRDMVGEHLDADCEDEINEIFEESDARMPLYVLSNDVGLNGAGCMIYRDVLKNFADSLGKDLIILPSSIHEVLLTPNEPGISYEELSSLVTCINQNEVSEEDRLSNQIYLYSRANDRLRLATWSEEPPAHSGRYRH